MLRCKYQPTHRLVAGFSDNEVGREEVVGDESDDTDIELGECIIFL